MRTMFRPGASMSQPPSSTTKLDTEAFFSKYKSLLTPEEFGRFHDLASKTRRSFGYRYYISSSDGKLDTDVVYKRIDTQRSRNADLSKMETILVEDVDVRCLVALDATYQLDPQFLLAYTSVGDKRSPDLEAAAGPADLAGKWYTAEISMLLEPPWFIEDSMMLKMFADMDKPWYRSLLARPDDTETEVAKPWWKEEIRTDNNSVGTKIRSKIACYCLTDKLRESR